MILASNRLLTDQSRLEGEGILHTVPVTRYSGNGLSRVINWLSYTAAATVRGLARRPVDVVYGSSPHLGAALAGLVIAKVHRARFVLEVRDLWPRILLDAGMLSEQSLIYRALRRLELFLYRQADAIVVLAKGSGWEIECEGIDPAKIHFIPNGAEPEDFDVEPTRAQLRHQFGLEGTAVVYAGAHGPANGLDLVLDAAEALRGEPVTFVLVGDGVAKADLQADATRRQLSNVEFWDPIPKTEIPKLFAAADVGLHCLADIPLFRHGVSPNKLYDYMAAGLPAVTNTPGEVAEMVEEAEAGLAVGPDELAVAVKNFLTMTDADRAEMGARGRAWMDANRSRRALASQLESLLDDLVGVGARRAS